MIQEASQLFVIPYLSWQQWNSKITVCLQQHVFPGSSRDVTRPQLHEAEATTHEAEAEATTHEAEAEATTHEAEAEAEAKATTHEPRPIPI